MTPSQKIMAAAACAALPALPAFGQLPSTPYQGTLRESGALVNGVADFQLRLFDSPGGTVQIGPTRDLNGVSVVDGRFKLPIDFGPGIFEGEDRYLEIAVRAPAGTGNFFNLTPRQRIAPVPHAQRVPGLDGHSLDAPDASPVDALFANGEGNVGIGTTSASGPLDVRSGNNSYVRVDSVHGDVHVNGGSDRIAGIFNDSTGFDARTDIIVNNWPQMVIYGGGGVGIGTLSPPRRLTVADGSLWTARFEGGNSHVTTTEFRHTAADATWNLDVVGTTNPFGTPGFLSVNKPGQALPAFSLAPNSWMGAGTMGQQFRLDFFNFATPDGRARANAWVTFSSARWKENVRTLDGALDAVMRMRGVSFDWRPEHGGTRDLGFVAEEVGMVVPELVTWEKDSPHAQGLAYDRVTALAVEAIKEQQRTLEDQRRAGSALGQRLEDLRLRIAAREVERGAQAR